MADAGTPLCTWAQFTAGAFADLGRNYTDVPAQNAILLEATRLCEQATSRRLTPFTGVTESHRALGVDPDEGVDGGDIPIDMAGALGQSYARALGASTEVRHGWLNEFAPRYPEFWTYADVSITVLRSVGGSETLSASQVTGPEPDSGHVWYTLGTFVPIGSWVRFTYSGGYTTVPADLVRAAKFMTASLLVTEIAPTSQSRDPDRLRTEAEAALVGYARE